MREVKTRQKVKYIVPAATCPVSQLDRKALTQADRRLISNTFHQLGRLCCEMPYEVAEECLLLLTTCRNYHNTLNALYVEAVLWCSEGQQLPGFMDGIDELRKVVSKAKKLSDGISKAIRMLEKVNDYLEEFQKKRNIFEERFDEIYHIILEYSESIIDPIMRNDFQQAFLDVNSGPSPDDILNGGIPSEEMFLIERLKVWFALAKGMTDYAIAFLSDFKIGSFSSDSIDALRRLKMAKQEVVAYGMAKEGWRNEDPPFFLDKASQSRTDDLDVSKCLSYFIAFNENSCNVARSFLQIMLPGPANNEEYEHLRRTGGFLLRPSVRAETIRIGSLLCHRQANMYVLIMDMRNSVGTRYVSQELKVHLAGVINTLRIQDAVASQVTFDDCHVIACAGIDEFRMSILRIWNSVKTYLSTDGFAGLRCGAVCGEMLINYKGNWHDDMLSAPPIDSCHNTIARAARLMSLDKIRWEDSEDALQIRKALGDWENNDSLLFLDGSIYQSLPQNIRNNCRPLDVLDLKSIGGTLCYVIQISTFKESE